MYRVFMVRASILFSQPTRLIIALVVNTGCPYEGVVEVERVIEVTRELFEMGCYQVSLGDTIGVGSPSKVDSLLLRLIDAELPLSRLVVGLL